MPDDHVALVRFKARSVLMQPWVLKKVEQARQSLWRCPPKDDFDGKYQSDMLEDEHGASFVKDYRRDHYRRLVREAALGVLRDICEKQMLPKLPSMALDWRDLAAPVSGAFEGNPSPLTQPQWEDLVDRIVGQLQYRTCTISGWAEWRFFAPLSLFDEIASLEEIGWIFLERVHESVRWPYYPWESPSRVGSTRHMVRLQVAAVCTRRALRDLERQGRRTRQLLHVLASTGHALGPFKNEPCAPPDAMSDDRLALLKRLSQRREKSVQDRLYRIDRIWTALDYLEVAASVRQDARVRIGFAVAAIEALCLEKGADASHRLAQNAACLVTSPNSDRTAAIKALRKLYDLRSAIVHGSPDAGDKVNDFVAEWALEFARTVMCAVTAWMRFADRLLEHPASSGREQLFSSLDSDVPLGKEMVEIPDGIRLHAGRLIRKAPL